MKFLTSISRNFLNAISIKTKRKIVLIESDDWGAIRTPSIDAYKFLVKKGIISSSDPYLKYDCLESEQDLYALFEVLESVKDINGNSAKFTANCIMANPDFEKIRNNNFETYHYEEVDKTFNRYPNHSDSLNIWFEGLSKKIFIPQLHGREHVNIGMWMDVLQKRDPGFMDAFNVGTYAINSKIVEALSRFPLLNDNLSPETALEDAINIFERRIGYKSISFVAPNYSWDDDIEELLLQKGIYFLQGSKKQNIILKNKTNKTSRYHYTGQKNKKNQMYLVRNCLFEPSVSKSLDYYDICLRQIENSFYWNTPAIICSHRLNYMSTLDIGNRDKNLKLLEKLLKKVKDVWPNVEFMSTDELAMHIKNKTL